MCALHRLSSIKRLLESLDIHPKKRFSQNFLIDKNVFDKIVDTAQIEEGDSVLEIGPGPGGLTESLLERGAHVLALEIDYDLAGHLRNYFGDNSHFQLVEGDALQIDFNGLLKGKKWKVVSNLPYHITTPLIEKCIDSVDLFHSMTFLVQKEVGERMAAHAGSKTYGSLSLYLQFFTEVLYAFTVKANSFYPAPKVHSCVMHLVPKSPPAVSDREGLFALIRESFCHRRKTLKKAVEKLYEPCQVKVALAKLGLLEQTRPEELSLEIFIALFEALASPSS
ncbi:MAG: ribosomal RNA small subunit methyltransferase A [Chlamydiia bacterium]|nr:ribosomal RNA small subunit methyltransferase A [Chlamydiia bacterium]